MSSNRRDFITQVGLSFGSILLLGKCGVKDYTWRFFTDKEAITTIAFAEQFIPEDKDPGATYANVVNFIDKQLVGPYTRFQKNYRDGLLAIENATQSMFNKSFYELDWDDQTAFMEKMEAGKLSDEFWKDVSQKDFFNRLLDHTMQGFYGSPRHGGNRKYASYKMLRLDYPHVLGQNRYK